MKKTIVILRFFFQVGFAAADAVSSLKLVEVGVPKDKLAILSVPLMPFQIILPFVISRYIVGPRPLDVFIAVVPYRYGISSRVFAYR